MCVDFLIGYTSSPNCVHLVSLEWVLLSKEVVQSLLNMCLYGGCYLILTEPPRGALLGKLVNMVR